MKVSFIHFKQRASIFLQAIGYSWKSSCLTMKGQLPKYGILQTTHRLEKGLLNDNPNPLWGWEKAERIASLLKENDDEFSNRTRQGVLKAYIEPRIIAITSKVAKEPTSSWSITLK